MKNKEILKDKTIKYIASSGKQELYLYNPFKNIYIYFIHCNKCCKHYHEWDKCKSDVHSGELYYLNHNKDKHYKNKSYKSLVFLSKMLSI